MTKKCAKCGASPPMTRFIGNHKKCVACQVDIRAPKASRRATTKTCTACEQEKPLTAFHVRSAAPDGRCPVCKDCRKGADKRENHARTAQERSEQGGACDKAIPGPASPEPKETATITPVEPEVDRLAHLRRVPVCKCHREGPYHVVNTCCEVHFACQIDTGHNRTPAAINYLDI